MKHVAILLAVIAGLAAGPHSAAELKAGTARVDVTPPTGGLMYGYGARGTNVSTGVHDPLYAKALVLYDGKQKVAIVTLDLGSFPAENTERVRAEVTATTGIAHVALIVSHTHSAPTFAEDFPSADKPWVREMESAVARAVAEANDALRPARIGVAWGEVREGHNRRIVKPCGELHMFWENRERIPTSPVDYSVGVLRVEESGGGSIATLVNFACHPVVLGPENLEISADYVGVLAKLVEEELGGECMFLQGAAGDINPFWDKTPPADGAYKQIDAMGKAVAEGVLAAVSRMGEYYEAPALQFHTELVPLATREDRARATKAFDAPVTTLLVGDAIALAFFPGEFFVEHGLRLKAESKFRHTFFVGYTNDALRYFPTIKATTEGGYGAASATQVEVGAGELLVNRALINLYYQADMIKP